MTEAKPRLAIVCAACGGGGSVANVALAQARHLASILDIRLISDSVPGADRLPPEIGRVAITPPTFHALRRFGHVPREVSFGIWSERALMREHGRRPLDFVLFHGHVPLAIAAGSLRRLRLAAGIVTHGDITDRPKGTYDSRLTRLYAWATPRAYRAASLVAALAPHMADVAIRNGARRQTVKLLPNGISPADIGLDGTFVAPAEATGSTTLRLLYVGRLSIEKGVDVLLHALRILIDRGAQAHLTLVGDGPLGGDLRDLARRLGIEDRVAFAGLVPRAALGEVYRSCQIICVPSRSDPLPTVVLEAMAAGRPVVGSAVGGIGFAIEDGVTGLVVAPDDPDALARALARFVDEAGLAEAMGRKGLARCGARFTWEACMSDLGAAIGEAIPARRS